MMSAETTSPGADIYVDVTALYELLRVLYNSFSFQTSKHVSLDVYTAPKNFHTDKVGLYTVI